MDQHVHANGILRACCAEPRNLERVEQARDARGFLRWKDRCTVCDRNHYGMEVEPPAIGARVASAADMLLCVPN